jgi:hypothetical protein
MRRAFIFLVLLFPNTAGAATQFRSVTEYQDPDSPRSVETIRIDGASYRIDHEGPALISSAAFSTDGGKTVTRLNSTLSTYFVPRKNDGWVAHSSQLYGVPFGVDTPPVASVKDVVLKEESTGEVIAGFATSKYVLRFMHDLKAKTFGETIPVIFHTTVEFWTTRKLELSLGPMDLRAIFTGESTVDPVVREALSGVKGLPLKRRLTVTRQIADGMVMTDVQTTTFDDFKTVDLPPEALKVPKGYRYQEPVIGF